MRKVPSNYVILDVVDGKTTCPKCGQVVRVSIKNRTMYSHTIKGTTTVCNLHFRYDFNVISEWVDPLKNAASKPKQKRKKRKKNRSPFGLNLDLEKDYPVHYSGRSIRAYSGGAPGSGKSR